MRAPVRRDSEHAEKRRYSSCEGNGIKVEAIPREISSRSVRVSTSRERRRARGGMPPRGSNTARMQLCGLSNARPISCSVCPTFQLLQTPRFSIAEIPNRIHGLMTTPPSRADLHQMVLHRPIECTSFTGSLTTSGQIARSQYLKISGSSGRKSSIF